MLLIPLEADVQLFSCFYIVTEYSKIHLFEAKFLMTYGGTVFSPFSPQLGLMSKEVAARKPTHGGADAITFGVYEAADLGEVTVPLGDKLDGGWLH